MGKIRQIGNTILRVYGNDHMPPHVHAIAPETEALIEIASLTVLRGAIRRADEDPVRAWCEANRPALVEEWNRCNPRFPM